MGILRKSIFQPAENNSIMRPLLTPEDIISDPNIVHNSNLRSKLSSNIIPESLPIPGITLDPPRKLTVEEQTLYDNYMGLYNKLNSEMYFQKGAKYIPDTAFGCHVKLFNDGLPELSTLTREKANALIKAHAFCFIDITELSEHFEPQPGTVVYVQMLDEARTYGRIVAAQNYASGIAVTYTGQTADNFKGLAGLIGLGSGLGSYSDVCGDRKFAEVVDLAPAASPADQDVPGYENAYMRGIYIGKLITTTFKGVVIAQKTAPFWNLMNDAAAAEGVTLHLISGFRTMTKQRSLYGNGEKGKFVAKPGFSNHQNGIAFDVCYASSRGIGADACAKQINWLRANAKKFNFCQPMDYEPWHWEYRPP